jgi:hypothetical protein
MVRECVVHGQFVLQERTCPLAPPVSRHVTVCAAEAVAFHSKIEVMDTLMREVSRSLAPGHLVWWTAALAV